MTTLVHMIVGISGGRHDGTQWPPMHGTVEVPDWEARDLIRGGNALPVSEQELRAHEEAKARAAAEQEADARETEAAAYPVSPGVVVQQPSVTAEASPLAQPAPEPAAPAQPAGEAPVPAAPKQAWIDFAIASGAEPDVAAAMTKADLMSRYGGRL